MKVERTRKETISALMMGTFSFDDYRWACQ